MKITKKLLSLSLIILAILSNLSFIEANAVSSDILNYDYKSSLKDEIIKKKGGDKLIKSIDSFIEKNKNNEEILIKVQDRILKVQEKNNTPYVFNVLEYMIEKINLKLANIDSINLDKKVLKLTTSTLTKEEKAKFDDELVKLQLNLLETFSDKLKVFGDYIEKQLNKEEKGSIKMNLNIDQDQIGKLKSSLNLNNYTATNSNFDSKIKGEINGLLEANLKDQKEINVKLDGLLDLIIKDLNIYLLLDKLNITNNKSSDEFKSYLNIIDKISKQNKYIKFGDEDNQIALNIIKNITPTKIISEGKTILSKPMFSAYKKEGNKYYIIPTKYLCDSLQILGCNDSEYKNILRELAKNGEIYIELGDKTKLGFNLLLDKRDNLISNGYIAFDKANIDEVSMLVQPSQEKYPNEKFTLNYKRNSNLDLKIYADKGAIDVKLNSKLDSNNRFSFIDFVSKGTNNELISNLKLENNILNGNFSIGKEEITGKIVGVTKLDNTIKNLNIDYSTSKSGLTGKFNYLDNNFSLENHYKDENTQFDIKLYGKWNSTEKKLELGNLDILEKSKPYGKKDFVENFKMNLNLKDTIINGLLLLKDSDGKDIFSLKTTGKYEIKYLELNNQYNILFPLNNNNNLDKINGNFNLKIDLKNNLDNANLYFDAFMLNKKIIDFELDGKGTIEYKKVEITVPTNVIDVKELKL